MCRNIKMLFNFEPPVTDEEIRNASLQFVRKISGFSKPSKSNEAAFEAADRSRCGPVAPPDGLYLVRVDYMESRAKYSSSARS